nr:ADP-ribosyl cyclase/cyclic ADP-ribose hydrolase 2 [Loxodonta africana]
MAVRGCLQCLPLLLLAAGCVDARWSGEGTSPHLRTIFLGRCSDYSSLLSPQQRICQDQESFHRFVLLEKHLHDTLSLFWENNHLLVTSYADNARRFMPLRDVLYGRVGDFLSWCRQKNASGLDYQSCPTSDDCENNPVDSYWKRASIQYSTDSSGVIYVMLNGSDPKGAYPVRGFFADYEIPNFQKDKITRFEIWVMHEIGGPNVESCGEGSVKILEERLKEMGFQYSCINDHLPVKLLQCVDHSTHPDCAVHSKAAPAYMVGYSLLHSFARTGHYLFLYLHLYLAAAST